MSSADTPRSPRPLEPVPSTPDARTDAILRLVRVVERLREPNHGCPWDLEQTVESLAPTLIEEAHEFVEAVETGNAAAQVEEAGDVLLSLLLICQVADQSERFDVARAAREAGDKLIRRHPHVFGERPVSGADTSREVLDQWAAIKAEERAAKKADDRSHLAGVPANLPAVQRAQRLGAKAVSVGFRWPDVHGALAKLREEVEELGELVEQGSTDRAKLEHELGDVLLAAAQIANYLDLDAEACARAGARRFEARFRHMEGQLDGVFEGRSLDAMMAAWKRAKNA